MANTPKYIPITKSFAETSQLLIGSRHQNNVHNCIDDRYRASFGIHFGKQLRDTDGWNHTK